MAAEVYAMVCRLLRPVLLAAALHAGVTSAASAPLPPVDARIDNAACRAIPGAPGPHTLLALPGRLLISQHDRRHFEQAGSMEEYDLRTNRLRTLPRQGEPAGLVLRPHGMALARHGAETWLYVINHDDPTPNGTHHSVLVYAVAADHLEFRQRLQDPLLSSPNHIAVAGDGDLYVSNDRKDGSSVLELALRMHRANLVHYRAGQGWRIVADGLNFPNGVQVAGNEVLAVLTFGNAVIAFPRRADGSLGPRRNIATLPNLDGLMPGPDPGSWLTVSHAALLDLLRHQHDAGHPSPGILYEVDTASGRVHPFFADDGHRISVMTSAVVADGRLFIGQAFDAFVLECPLRGPAH
jgi:hypothetical protein